MELTDKGGDIMKRGFALLLVLLLLVGCSRESTYQAAEVENVSMSIQDISPTGATVVIQDDNWEPFVYGEWYRIEREKNGIWYEVKPVISNYGFNEIGWLTDDQGKLTMTMDWEWLYGKLPQGQYRLLKQAGAQIISAEFCVE